MAVFRKLALSRIHEFRPCKYQQPLLAPTFTRRAECAAVPKPDTVTPPPPSPLLFPVFRSLRQHTQVRKTYEKLQKKEQNRVAAAAAAATSASSSDTSPSQSAGARSPPPSFVPPPRIVSTAVAAAATAAAAVVETTGLDNGELASVGAPVRGPFPSGARCRSEEVCCGGGSGSRESALEVGERLNEAVRLCSIEASVGSAEGEGERREGAGGGGGLLGALTLSEAELSRPRRLLNDLRLLTCRPAAAEEAPVAVLAEGGERKDVERAAVAEVAAAELPGKKKTEFLSPALAEEEARRVGAPPCGHDPLMETAWLAERFPKVTLGDLLVNRLELSLWASYWDGRRPRESMT